MTDNSLHTNRSDECFIDHISSIVEKCDHEYYMSALGPPQGSLERAKRGRKRILESIVELEKIDTEASCSACHEEIQSQIKKQRDGVLEIEKVWKLTREQA
jgi:hypothetical protein